MIVEGKNSWYIDREEIHAVTLSAGQSTTIKLNAHILSENFRQNGTFEVRVSACKTKRESGHLDFGTGRSSESIMLPYVHTGVKHIEYNKERVPIAYYTMDGKRVNQPPHGLYIIKYSDGKVEKKMR